MKFPLGKWMNIAYPSAENIFTEFKEKLQELWDLPNLKIESSIPVSSIPVLPQKLKDSLQDIFAHIAPKRILFQEEKRWLYTCGRNSKTPAFKDSEFKIADAVILPIHPEEIQDVLKQAQIHNIQIQTFSMDTIRAIPLQSKNKLYCIVSLENMQKIVRFEPEKYQITVQTGLTLGQLHSFLSEKGWELPINTGTQYHQSIHEWMQNQYKIDKIIQSACIHSLVGTFQFDQNFGFSIFNTPELPLGIISEVTLTIRPKAKYERKVEAIVPDMNAATEILQELERNGIQVEKAKIFKNKNSVFNIVLEGKESKIDIGASLTSLIKKSELFGIDNEVERNIAIDFTFYEYAHSRSSAIIKTKEIIQQYQGKIPAASVHLLHEKYLENLPYFSEYADKLPLDFLQISTYIPVDKIQEYQSEIDRKLSKTSYYKKNKWSYFVQFTTLASDVVRLDFFFVAASAYRKSENSFLELQFYFREYLHTDLERDYSKNQEHVMSKMDFLKILQKMMDTKNVFNLNANKL